MIVLEIMLLVVQFLLLIAEIKLYKAGMLKEGLMVQMIICLLAIIVFII